MLPLILCAVLLTVLSSADGGGSAERCHWQCYLDRYGDLQKAFGSTNIDKAREHWYQNGIKEGRDCTCPPEDIYVNHGMCSEEGIKISLGKTNSVKECLDKCEVAKKDGAKCCEIELEHKDLLTGRVEECTAMTGSTILPSKKMFAVLLSGTACCFNALWEADGVKFKVSNGKGTYPTLGEGEGMINSQGKVEWSWFGHNTHHVGTFSNDCKQITWENGAKWKKTGDCDGDEILGCTNPGALNYNAKADTDDDSCKYLVTPCITLRNVPDEKCDWYNPPKNHGSEEQCKQQCTNDRDCTAYQFRARDGNCDLIRGSCSKSDFPKKIETGRGYFVDAVGAWNFVTKGCWMSTRGICNWQCYLDRYGDLQKAYGSTNIGKAKQHWAWHGLKEGRDCTCSPIVEVGSSNVKSTRWFIIVLLLIIMISIGLLFYKYKYSKRMSEEYLELVEEV